MRSNILPVSPFYGMSGYMDSIKYRWILQFSIPFAADVGHDVENPLLASAEGEKKFIVI